MYSDISLIGFFFLWLFAEGAIQGWFWAGPRRNTNSVIRGSVERDKANGFLDFHTWRIVEVLSVQGIAISALGWDYWMLIAGLTICFTAGVYERILVYIGYGKFFVSKPDFFVWKWKIPRRNWQDVSLIIIGLMLIVGHYWSKLS